MRKLKIKNISRILVIVNVILNLLIGWYVWQNYHKIEWIEKEYEIIDSIFDISKDK